MDIRKSAADLSAEERDRFLTALIRLKHRPVQGGPPGFSRYNQFVLVHWAIMHVVPPENRPDETVNYGHWNIGFCPWHRMFIREFELALQAEVPGVTLPYWDWAGGLDNQVFTGEFLGSLRQLADDETPAPLAGSVLRNPLLVPDRPAWWPDGVDGYPLHTTWPEGPFGDELARGSSERWWRSWSEFWHVPGGDDRWLAELVVEWPGVHPYWFFWTYLEQGGPPFLVSERRRPTHNTGHVFIGGHMADAEIAPHDPAFWLHHANIDRLWDSWQRGRLAAVPGSSPADHYPPPEEEAPFGNPAPPGHRRDDPMWPWVGDIPGYRVRADSLAAAPGWVLAAFPDYTGVPALRVRDVLDTETMDPVGYRYAPPLRMDR